MNVYIEHPRQKEIDEMIKLVNSLTINSHGDIIKLMNDQIYNLLVVSPPSFRINVPLDDLNEIFPIGIEFDEINKKVGDEYYEIFSNQME